MYVGVYVTESQQKRHIVAKFFLNLQFFQHKFLNEE